MRDYKNDYGRKQAREILGWIFNWYHESVYHNGQFKFEQYFTPDEFEVHHKDGNPLNNSLGNLQVLTINEHREIHKYEQRENGGQNKKSVICIETGIIYDSAKEAGVSTNINNHHIGEVCNGRRKTAGGYHWKFI